MWAILRQLALCPLPSKLWQLANALRASSPALRQVPICWLKAASRLEETVGIGAFVRRTIAAILDMMCLNELYHTYVFCGCLPF